MLRSFGSCSLVAMLLLSGCTSAPSRVSAPPINPNAGADAVTKLDKNTDGGIDAKEAPELFFEPGSKGRIDANSDGKITADEISARVSKWADSKIGLTQYSLIINLDGKPLEGAIVTLIPEEWLGDQIKGGVGTGPTDATGRVNLSIPAADLKADETGLQGMRLGIYKVQVTHPSFKIPEKFNTATEAGVEVAPDDPNIGRNVLELSSR
jgi:hypothetical protein